MAPHTWSHLGETVSDATHVMYYRGQKIKEAYYRGEKIWEEKPIRKTLLTGSERVTVTRVLNAMNDTFTSKILIDTNFTVTILYEYGPRDSETFTQESRIVPAANGETQALYHVCQIPEPMPLRDFNYSAYLLERRGMGIRFDAKFMSYPFQDSSSGVNWTYPGTPEAVDIWWVRTIRR